MGNIGIGRDKLAFVVKETTHGGGGTITGAEAVLVVDDPTFKQERDFAKDEQKRMTVSQLPPGSYFYKPGEWNMTTYIKPNGSLGVAPVPDVLLDCLFGVKTIVGATSVTYTLGAIADEVPSALIVYKNSNIVYWNFGCILNEGEFPVSAGEGSESNGRGNFSGQILRQKKAGVSAVDGVLIATDTAIVVDDAREFETETRIEFDDGAGGWEDDGGVGYLIDSIDYATETLTIAAGGLANGVADDAEVRGWLPTATEAGNIVSGRLGDAEFDAVAVDIANATVKITNNFTIINDEKTDSEYPISIIRASDRIVELSYEKLFRKDTGHAFYDAGAQTQQDIALPVGNVAGNRYRFEIPQAENQTPDLSGEEDVRLSVPATAYSTTAYDDEISMVLD